MELKGRSISKGIVEGTAIVSKKPFSLKLFKKVSSKQDALPR